MKKHTNHIPFLPDPNFKVCFDRNDPETMIQISKHIHYPPDICKSSVEDENIDLGIDIEEIQETLRMIKNSK